MNRKLFISILILIWTGLSFAQNTISIRTNSTASGDTGTFAIVMKNNGTVNGLNFLLRYDPNIITPLRIAPAGNASLLGGSSASLFGDDRISFLVYDVGTNMLSADSGTIFEIEYVVTDSLHDSTSTPLIFTEGMAADSSIHAIAFDYVGGSIPISPVVGVNNYPTVLPQAYRLEQNYPNPFNPKTTIRYAVSIRSWVVLKIFNILGQEVKTLVDEIQEAGYKHVFWNSDNTSGSSVATGVYFYKLETTSMHDPLIAFTQVKKMILMR